MNPTAQAPAERPPRPAATTEIRGLHPSTPQRLPFGCVDARAYLLERDEGNVLIYANRELVHDAKRFAELGGVARRYLGHWHEAMFDAPDRPGLDAPVFVHVDDLAETKSRRPVRATFSRRHHFGDDLEVIPMPGHTPGSTAYLWDNGERRVLFTADSVMVDAGEWLGAMLDSSDRRAYVESLRMLAGLEFDALVPWAVGGSDATVDHVDPAVGRQRLLAIADRIAGGADR